MIIPEGYREITKQEDITTIILNKRKCQIQLSDDGSYQIVVTS